MTGSHALKDQQCDTCGKPATMYATDIREKPPVDNYRVYEPVGKPKFGCDDHPVESVRR